MSAVQQPRRTDRIIPSDSVLDLFRLLVQQIEREATAGATSPSSETQAGRRSV
jgi:hypothetical protein